MGTIGLFDADLFLNPQPVFNLELMKLATYHKRKRDLVTLTDIFRPERFSTFYYRKDISQGDALFSRLMRSNIKYGGLAFTAGKYLPLPMEIEMLPADTSIYENYRSKFKPLYYVSYVAGAHIRLSLDGKTVTPNFLLQNKTPYSESTVHIHDLNLGQIVGAPEAIRQILSDNPTRFHMTWASQNDIYVDSSAEMLKWIKMPPSSRISGKLILRAIPSREEFIPLLKLSREKRVPQWYILVTAPYENEEEMIKDIMKIFELAVLIKAYCQKVTIIYEKGFMETPIWAKTIELLREYSRAKYKHPRESGTVHGYLHATGDLYQKQKGTEVFTYMYYNNYPLLQAMYERSARSEKEQYEILF